MPLTNSKDKKETNHKCGWFLLFKKAISDITLMHYSNCFIDIEPRNP